MAVVQLVEHLVVVQDVAGSSPVSHPTAPTLMRRGFLFCRVDSATLPVPVLTPSCAGKSKSFDASRALWRVS